MIKGNYQGCLYSLYYLVQHRKSSAVVRLLSLVGVNVESCKLVRASVVPLYARLLKGVSMVFIPSLYFRLS